MPASVRLKIFPLLGFFILLWRLPAVSGDCTDVSYSTTSVEFDKLVKINRIAISGQIAAFKLEISIGDNDFSLLKQANDQPQIIYSTLSHTPTWTSVDILAHAVRVHNAMATSMEDLRQPLLMMTICDYDTEVSSFDDNGYMISTQKAGLVSMYENELILLFRTFQSGLFFFSMADQGDVLVAQIVRGTVQIIFDFGSLSPATISGGRALDDGHWHELRWLHQFDSVQLFVDKVLLNETSPSGLYRKLDLHTEIHIAGRPPDDYSDGIESTFTGCLARLQLNSVDLLRFAPMEGRQRCSMPSPPSLTLLSGSEAIFKYSFLPFSFEFRTFEMDSVLLNLLDEQDNSLLKIVIDHEGIVFLTTNATKHKQQANPPSTISDGSWHSFLLRIRSSRLEVDIDDYTVLWMEGHEVRKLSRMLQTLVIATPGCYRSVTVDFGTVPTSGNVSRHGCSIVNRCIPSPCENGGKCQQVGLDDYKCVCSEGYRGHKCHTSDYPRSCEEWLYLRGPGRSKMSKGKNVTLDLDGGGPLKAFNVVCRTEKDELGMDVVTTIVEHDLRKAMIVTGDNAPGAVRKTLKYGLDTAEMDRLVEGFENCKQWMRFECRGGSNLMTNGQDRSPSSWYSTRSDKHGLQWGSAPPYSRMCSCAVNGTCRLNRMCNCDSGEDSVDEGFNTYTQLLPVTGLFLGGTSKTSSVDVQIGSLQCHSRISFEPITFSDRNARLTGSRVFHGNVFHLTLQLKFLHPNMNVFVWESSDSLHWFHLYLHEGRFVAELVNGGETIQLSSNTSYNDGNWHQVYWECDSEQMVLKVDGRTHTHQQHFVLPSALHWTFGSRTESGQSGYAGVIRNVYLCGEELMLSTVARKEPERVGEDGYCRPGLCKNSGRCVDKYDGYSCDCSAVPFGGVDCGKEYGMYVPLGSSLSIPWQNPAHVATCHRIAVQTTSTNVSLIRTTALFGDSVFNMTLNDLGYLTLAIYDGFYSTHHDVYQKRNMSDDVLHDIAFCANDDSFNLTIDGEQSISFTGNWTFFQTFNNWSILDKMFVGCVSRLQIGTSSPLKNPKAARLNYSGKIRFGTCPIDLLEAEKPKEVPTGNDHIYVNAISPHKQHIVSVTSIIGLTVATTMIILLSILVCYMRSRPEGVYKTNESGSVPEYSPTSCRSEEPLVRGIPNNNNKEYFC